MLALYRLLELLDYDPKTGNFTWKTSKGRQPAGKIAGSTANGRERVICIDRKLYSADVLAWFYMTGEWEKPAHIDGRRTNNRFSNLTLYSAPHAPSNPPPPSLGHGLA